MMRAGDLTGVALSPAGVTIDDSVRAEIRQRLIARIGPLVEPTAPGRPIVVTLALLRQARTRVESLGEPEDPFAWKPIFVRRSLGLAIVAACANGRFRSPLEAASPVADEAVSEWERTGWRTFHWEPWFAGLADGARAVVLADAVGWATSIWLSFDWNQLRPLPQVGGGDDQWICPAGRTVRLKGRSELRVPLSVAFSLEQERRPTPADEAGNRVALVSVSGGCPTEWWSEELAYLALVAGLRWPTRPVPPRVLGLWPDSGSHLSIEIDEEALHSAADRVVDTVRAVVEASQSAAA